MTAKSGLEKKKKLRGLCDHLLSAKLVSTFADRGYHMVSVMDPYGRIGFSRPELLFFFSSSSSIVLTRLSGPPSGPATPQKIW
jgi:hypothetical protein